MPLQVAVRMWFLSFVCLFLNRVLYAANLADYPYCTGLLFDFNHEIDVEAMLYNCSSNIQGALLPPSTFSPTKSNYQATVVNVSMAVNSFIQVDDIATQVTLDIWLRQWWQDPRIKLPEEMWNSLNPAVYREGIEISPYIRNSNELNIWLPDTYIIESVDTQTVSELIHLFPNSYLFWSRHFLLTLTEPTMDLHNYPNDQQDFTITFQSFAYSTDYVNLTFIEPSGGVVFTTESNGDYYVSLNQIWTYQSYSAYVADAPSGIFFDENRLYSTVFTTLTFQRQSFGIVFRLALPICLCLCVAGFSFWAAEDKRIDVVMNMLLVTAALYLVIGTVIPLVGYYTILDYFITTAFIILAATMGIHFILIKFEQKKDKYPLLAFVYVCSIYFFRMLWVPLALLAFIYYFQLFDSLFIIIPYAIVWALAIGNGIAHYPKIRETYYTSLAHIKHIQQKKVETFNSSQDIEMISKTRPSSLSSPSSSSHKEDSVRKLTTLEKIATRAGLVDDAASKVSLHNAELTNASGSVTNVYLQHMQEQRIRESNERGRVSEIDDSDDEET